MMKRLLSGLAAVAMALFSVPTIIASAADPEIIAELGSVSGNSGESVEVPINITNPSGYFMMGFTVVWDKTLLELESVSTPQSTQFDYETPYLTPVDEDNPVEFVPDTGYENGTLIFNFGSGGKLRTKTGSYGTVKFKILKNTTKEISFSVKEDSNSTAVIAKEGTTGANASDLKEIDITVNLGKVTVTDAVEECSHTTLTPHEQVDATCSAPGTKAYYECTECHAKFYDASKTQPVESDNDLVIAIDPTAHKWGTTIKYDWSTDHKTCTAYLECDHNKAHHYDQTVTCDISTVPNTCTTAGKITYTAKFTDAKLASTKEYVDNTSLPVLGHNWGTVTYTWAPDYSTCTAHATCQRDGCGVEETETVNTNYTVVTAATCATNGQGKYTSKAFTKDVFKGKSDYRTVVIESTGAHNYQPVGQAQFNSDFTDCTITVKCNGCNDTKTLHAVSIEDIENVPATCADGHITYKATFNDSTTKYTGTATGTKTLPANGTHNYGTPTITWNEETRTLTGSHTCSICNNVETENATVTLDSTTPATCTATGVENYTTNFTITAFNEANTYKTVSVTVPAKGHEFDTTSYSWNSNNTACTARRDCKNCDHFETADATVSSTVAVEPKCETKGSTKYTATFNVNWAETQEKTVDDIPKKGHTPGEATYENVVRESCDVDGTGEKVIKCTVCGKEISRESVTILAGTHTPGEPVEEDVVPATEDEEGSYKLVTYCTECGTKISSEDKTIDKLTVSYTVDPAEFTEGSDSDAVFTVKRNINDDRTKDEFVKVSVDGTELTSEQIATAAGSLKLSLLNSYVKTLSVGDHVVVITMAKGELNTTLTVKSAQNNGGNDDPNNNDPVVVDPDPNGGNNVKTGVATGAVSAVLLLVAAAAITTKKRR